MNLAEFLAQTDVAALSSEDALAAAIAYEETKVWRIEGQVRKTQVETTVIMNDTIERLEKMVQNIEMLESPNGTQAAQRKLARAILHALSKLYMTEFYINLNDPEVKSMFDNALALGVLLQAEYDDILDAATHTSQPFANTTLFDVVSFRDAGETLVLPANNNQHTSTIGITTQPLKPVDIVVEQRFSKDGTDWTEWHSVGAFRNVDYPQRNYEASVPKAPAAFRELRAVSPLTLGMSTDDRQG